MRYNIQDVANRIAGLRDALDITADEMAASIGVSADQYRSYETGGHDIPVSVLCRIAEVYSVDLSALLSGNEPRMKAYFVSREGRGVKIEHEGEYAYYDLAWGLGNRQMSPFIVTVEPNAPYDEHPHNMHDEQEFNYILRGRVEMKIANSKIVLEAGDSIMFDSRVPHCVNALDGKQAAFIAVIAH